MPTVTLIGYRGTGKTTVAAGLARRLGCPWWDADVELERRVGTTIASLLRDHGEPYFRDEESGVLGELLAKPEGVLATGGGVILRPGNREHLRKKGGCVVWLTAPSPILRRRLAADPTTASRRPGLTNADPLAEIESILAVREPLYRACADVVIDASVASPEEVVESILRALPALAGAARPTPPEVTD
jgi:shikimate kinase